MALNKQPLLSICIPTYNRAEILRRTLAKITSDKDFDEDIEIVISDNASTDNTQKVCQEFCASYKNIHYYKNDENINDSNFFLVLSKGRGKYVKLSNDTITYKTGALKSIKEKIQQASLDENIFFFQNNEFYSSKSIKFQSLNQFMNISNYYITWIANFGCWNHILSQITTPQKYSQLKLTQVDWFLQLVKQQNIGTIHYGNYYEVEDVPQKGGYNIYDVFINNFLHILTANQIKGITFEIQKYRLLRYFIFPWKKKLQESPGLYKFETAHVNSTIMKNYWYYPYTYIFFLYFIIRNYR